MLSFKKLELNDIETIRPFFKNAQGRICDNTIGTVTMWRKVFDTHFVLCNDAVVLKMTALDGTTVFSLPCGIDDEAVSELKCYCENNNISLVLNAVTEEQADSLTDDIKECTRDEAWDDYLYNASDLAAMTGRRYAGQRNHINFFINNNPGWKFELISLSNIQRVIDFHKNHVSSRATENKMLLSEHEMVSEVLNNYDKYGMLGGFISLADGNIVAMAIGEVLGDTLYEHIEKAIPEVRGAYQLIAREFANNFSDQNTKYVNREEDMGEEGLRKSKLSYHPCDKIKKYTIVME